MAIKPSGEMYLETIYVLSRELTHVRSIDVAERMNFSKPSVSRAVSHLKNDGYLTVDANGHLTLTDSGRAIAQKIYERHTLLSQVLMRLGVPKDIALEDACQIEHVISDATFAALKQHSKSR